MIFFFCHLRCVFKLSTDVIFYFKYYYQMSLFVTRLYFNSRLYSFGVSPVLCCPPGVRVTKGLPSNFFGVKGISLSCGSLPTPLLFLPHHLHSHRLYPIVVFHFSRPFPFLHSLTVHLFCVRQNMELSSCLLMYPPVFRE